MKSERLKKLESELKDLEKWLDLGLVPKKDLEKHKLEIESIKAKMDEERQRLIFLKESGEVEDYNMPKKSNQKQLYEHQSMPDIETDADVSEVEFEVESTTMEADHTSLFDIEMAGEEKASSSSQEYETDEDPYSERNRWKRSTEIADPDRDDW